MDISLRKETTLSLLLILLNLLNVSQPQPQPDPSKKTHERKIGLILDMGSWSGKAAEICIHLAISDFYAVNSDYGTKIVLHTKDSKGEPQHALLAVHHLLNNIKVQTIIVQETSLDGKLLALFANKAKVPFFSFTGISSSVVQHPYLFQIKQDETILFKGIAALVESYYWKNVVIFYEDTHYGRETIPYLVEFFQEKNIIIAYTSVISPFARDDEILHELDKVINVGTTTLIMHMSSSVSSKLLLNAKKLEMVNEKFTWIITDDAMDILHSIEGAFSLKPYIPASHELHNFISKWKRAYVRKYPTLEVKEMSVLGIYAYDAIWALAECFERVRNVTAFVDWKQDVGVSLTIEMLVNEISRIRFKGLSGQFHFNNGKLVSEALELVKVRGSKERTVGFWTLTDGINKKRHASNSSDHSSKGRRKETFRPGGSITTPILDKELIIAVPVSSTFTELVNVVRNPETNKTNFTGYCIDVFVFAMSGLSHEEQVRYKFVPFDEPHGDTSGSYDDLLSHVSRQDYDGAVADITILANRSKWVDFTVPYSDFGVGTLARIDYEDMWIFFKPFGLYVWLAIVASFVLVGLLVWLFERPLNQDFQGPPAQQIATVFWFTFMTIFFAQRERLTNNWTKFIVVVWLFLVLILIACYTAILSSLLTVQQIQIAPKGNIIGYKNGSFMQGVIIDNRNFLNYKLQPFKTPEEYADALSKNESVAAIIDEIPYLKIFLAHYSTGYAVVSSEPSTSGFGFAFQKGSPLVHLLSREIAKLREDGTLEVLEKKWFKSSSSSTRLEAANKPKILTLGDLSGLFIIGATAFGLALLTYLYDFFNERFHLNDHVSSILAGGRMAIMTRYLYLRNLIIRAIA